MSGSDPAIVVTGIGKRFGDIVALQDLDLEVPRGRVFGLLGPNGAGKTTLVRILTTLLKPDTGRAEVLGHDVLRDAETLRPKIGLAGQYAAVDENLTGRENLRMVGLLYHLSRSEARRKADEVLERFSLLDAADRPVKTYSGGMRRRLDLGASLVGDPEVLFLDEPTTGLDPRTRLDLWEMIEQLVAGGTTLMLTTQYLDEADALADRIAVIDHGRLIAEGTTADLKGRIQDVLDIQVDEAGQLADARRALTPLSGKEPHVDETTLRISFPVSDGTKTLLRALRTLDDEGIGVRDVGLHRPTLDDVFLALTGESVDGEDAVAGAKARRGRSRA